MRVCSDSGLPLQERPQGVLLRQAHVGLATRPSRLHPVRAVQAEHGKDPARVSLPSYLTRPCPHLLDTPPVVTECACALLCVTGHPCRRVRGVSLAAHVRRPDRVLWQQGPPRRDIPAVHRVPGRWLPTRYCSTVTHHGPWCHHCPVTAVAPGASQITPERLAEVNARSNTVRVGNATFVDTELQLGSLKGNEFHVGARPEGCLWHSPLHTPLKAMS